MKNGTLWITVGFMLFFLGITSLILQLINVHWAFLRWMEWGGGLVSFILKILMIVVGIMLFILARTDWEQEKRESAE